LDERRFDLPPQLQPYQVGRVERSAPPTQGLWRAGSVVWNREAWAGVNSSVPSGWVCVTPGRPGLWRALALSSESAAKTDDIGASPVQTPLSDPPEQEDLLVQLPELGVRAGAWKTDDGGSHRVGVPEFYAVAWSSTCYCQCNGSTTDGCTARCRRPACAATFRRGRRLQPRATLSFDAVIGCR
jgi:hypothetical protein